jgi:hypothetical protein
MKRKRNANKMQTKRKRNANEMIPVTNAKRKTQNAKRKTQNGAFGHVIFEIRYNKPTGVCRAQSTMHMRVSVYVCVCVVWGVVGSTVI